MRTVLSLWKGPLKANRRPMAEIVSEVARRYDVSVPDLKGENTKRWISRPRQEAYALMHREGYSLAQIGRFMGGKDHTTTRHGVRAHWARQAAQMQEAA